MSANFTIPSEKITFRGGEFTVRGLNAEDFTRLTRDYLKDIKEAAARHATPSGRIAPDKSAEMILDVASHFPAMAAETISACADSPEKLTDFKNLPVMVTVKALDAIFRLTAEDGGIELGKAAAGLASVLEANGLKLGPLAIRLRTIIESAENTSPSSLHEGMEGPRDTPSED